MVVEIFAQNHVIRGVTVDEPADLTYEPVGDDFFLSQTNFGENLNLCGPFTWKRIFIVTSRIKGQLIVEGVPEDARVTVYMDRNTHFNLGSRISVPPQVSIVVLEGEQVSDVLWHRSQGILHEWKM